MWATSTARNCLLVPSKARPLRNHLGRDDVRVLVVHRLEGREVEVGLWVASADVEAWGIIIAFGRDGAVGGCLPLTGCGRRPESRYSVLHKAAWLERLLAEGVSKTKQADGEIHEDQLNFLVNRLDEEVSASLANNAGNHC